MSLMINGMDMPTKDAGVFCRLYRYKDGTAQFTQYGRTSFDQPDNHYFRAVEIPSPHGRLIDADKLWACLNALEYIAHAEGGRPTFAEALEEIAKAPTIIEAEE